MNKFETALKKYLDIFAGQEMYFVNDTRNLELFSKTPGNKKTEDVRTKVSAQNDADVRTQLLEDDMIRHIVELNIDDRLKRHDVTVVEEIAHLNAQGKDHHLLHFASVYCNLHDPEIFPIYSEQHFPFYRKYIQEYKLPLDMEKLNTYSVFSQALNDLVKRLGLQGKMNYLQLRKFGWLYAENVLRESRES
jgi:hypothetical protein